MEKRLKALADASARIFAARSVDETLRLITEAAREIVGAHLSVTSLTLNEGWAQAIVSASLSDKYAAWRGYAAKPSGKGIYARVCAENRPMRLTQAELEAHPAFEKFGAEKGRHPPLRGWLAAPLTGRDGVNLGLIQLSDKYEGDFDAGDEGVLVQLARLGALAIENQRLVETAQAAERRFHEFARIGSDILWETDSQHRFTDISCAEESPLKPHIAAILGETRWGYLGADTNDPRWKSHIADVEAHRPFRNFEYTTAKHGGRESRLSVSGWPIFAPDGAFQGYRGTTKDITDLRKAEAAAKASEERFRNFAEIASDWLWETDLEHRFTYFGGSSGTLDERPYGKTRWEISGADLADPKWRAHLAELAAGRPFRNFEYTRIDQTGRVRHISVSGQPLRGADGALAGYRGIASDVTAQREAEAAARRADQQYRQVIETANEGVWLLDGEARTVLVNRRMADMLGYAPEEILGRTVYDFRPPEDRDAHSQRWSERRRGIAEQREVRFMRRDGSVFLAQVSAAPVKDAAGNFVGALGMVTDITERKRAEAALQASEDRFRDFAEVGSDWLWESDAEHRVTMMDGPAPTAKNFVFGKRRWEYGDVDPDSPEWRRHRRDLDLRLPFRNFAYQVLDGEGKQRWFTISGKPVFDAEGAFAGYRGTTRDVTAQHEAERRLRASEGRFRDFAEVASDWMWESDAEHRFSYFTPSRDQSQPDLSNAAIGKTRWGYAGADPNDPKWQAHIAELGAHRPFRNFEYSYRRPDGTMGVYVVSGVPVHNDDGSFAGYRGTTTDITAQRAAEAAARESERKFRNIVETANEGIWMLDAERRTTYVNPRMAEMLGYTPEEMLGRHHWDFMAAEDRAAALESSRQRPGGEVEKVELRYLRKDGSPIWVIVTSNVVEDLPTGALAVLGMVTDITDRKKAEEAVAASEARIRDFAEIGADWMWETDARHRLTFMSGTPLRRDKPYRGLTRCELADGDPESPAWRAHFADLEARRPFRDMTFDVVGSDGRRHYLVSSGRPVYDANGVFTGYRGTTADRTRQHEAEVAAAESEKKFRQVIETASEGVWITNAEQHIIFANHRVEEILGYGPGELVGMSVLDTIPADRREIVKKHWGERQSGRSDRFEARHLRKDGSEVTMLLSATPMHDSDGRFTGSFVMFVDISEQRRVQAALEESEKKLLAALESNQAILSSISDGFVALDNDWRFTFINPAAERMWNKKAEELLGKTIFNSLQVDPNNPFHANYLASKRSGEPVAFTAYSEMFGKWLEVRGYPHAAGYTLFFDDVSEERRGHRELIKSRRRLEAAREMNERIFETSLDLICITDRNGDFLQVNPGTCQQFGYPEQELIGHNASEFIHADGIDATRQALRDARKSRSLHTFENRCRRRDGQFVPMNWSVAWSESEQKYFLIGRDMSERMEAQERLNRSQRLEAIGQLTGGIAHDFNNLLTVIMGNSDTLARGLTDQPKLRRRAELSLEAARRAAELTSQLLAFARRQTLAPKAVEANRLVKEMHELMRRSLGAQIEIDLQPGPKLWLCKVDSTQLETALLNLALNARDAMPGGGTLTIATANRSVEANGDGSAGTGASDLAAGDYVSIAVSDTGTGMPPEVQARAFEPFFTTKDIGKGSGLGLAMVYGFVKQSGGHVAIESAAGRGTTVTLFLPRAQETVPAPAPAPTQEGTPLPGGSETILVVEDDAAVRELVTDQLRALGYRVLVAGNGPTARNILYGGEKVDLLFTDVMMPGGLTGTQLADEAEKQIPALKILFTTGYSEVPALKNSRRGMALLRKPYKTRDLARTVRDMLDAAA